MIRIFWGEDTAAARRALGRAVHDEKKSRPSAVIFRFDDLNFDPAAAREALSAISMFGDGNIVIFDGVTEHPEGSLASKLVLEYRGSNNVILCRERAVEKETIEKLKTHALIQEFPLKTVKKEEHPNNFAIADALARRDRRGAWVEFERAMRRGVPAEEIHGIIFWQVKTLYISATQTKEEAARAGVKDYSWKKGAQNAKNFLISDLERLLELLKDMYHRSHRGELDLSIAIEKLLLTI